MSAPQPFEFLQCLELREMLGRSAWDARELLAGIEDAPAESIIYHTRSYFLRSRYLAAPYPSDFATWAAWNSMEGDLPPALVKPATIRKMHTKVVDMPPKPDAPVGTPSSGGYGLGWGTVSLPFAPEPLVFHGGSNNMNLAYIVLQPKQELGLVMMTNISGPKANEALMAITELLYKRFSADQTRATPKP